MPKIKNNVSDSSREDVSISEMAEMVGMYYNEIKSVAENLEKPDSLLPKSDIEHLLKSLVEYSKVGTELTTTFSKKVETFVTVKSADLNTCE